MPLQLGLTTELRSDGQLIKCRDARHIEPGDITARYVWVHRRGNSAPSHPPRPIDHRCLEQHPDGSWQFCESVPAALGAGLARELLAALASAEVVSARLADAYTRTLSVGGFRYGAVRVSISLDYAVGQIRASRAGGRLRVTALDTRGQPFIESRWDRPSDSAPMIWYPGDSNPWVSAALEQRWRAAGMALMRSQGRAIRALLRLAPA